MGVISQIHLQRPPDGIYQPGSLVSGTVKYIIDKETIFKDIVVSLIGKGKCRWSERRTDGKTDDTYYGTEEIVSSHMKLIDTKLETTTLSQGEYSNTFQFLLPKNIPPTYGDFYSNIRYNIILKFERPGLFNFTKTFKTEIPVLGTVTATLPDEPIIYGLQKSVYHFFSSNKRGFINFKGTIKKSFLTANENAEIEFLVENRSKIDIISTTIRLVEILTYTAKCGKKKIIKKNVKNCKNRSERIGAGEVKLRAEIPIAETCKTIQNSKVLSRDYKLDITLDLPMPHINASLEIPIVIGSGDKETEAEEVVHDTIPDDSPPSYWEAMAEDDNK